MALWRLANHEVKNWSYHCDLYRDDELILKCVPEYVALGHIKDKGTNRDAYINETDDAELGPLVISLLDERKREIMYRQEVANNPYNEDDDVEERIQEAIEILARGWGHGTH